MLWRAADFYQFIHPFLFDAATHAYAFIQWVERQHPKSLQAFIPPKIVAPESPLWAFSVEKLNFSKT